MSDDYAYYSRLHRHRVLSEGQQAAKEKLRAAWPFFLASVSRQFKRKPPKGLASEWIGSEKNTFPKLCGISQVDLIAKFGVPQTTVRRMRATLVVLLEIGEGHSKPTPPKQTFKQFRDWDVAEKAARETTKRKRKAAEEARTQARSRNFGVPDFLKGKATPD